MIADAQLDLMKNGSYLINNSRGTVVDLKALAKHLNSGHLAGAAVDVFPVEPESNGPGFSPDILGCKNVIMTPHIGGSTEEAQRAIGFEVGNTLTRFIKYGGTTGSVNFPEIDLNSPPSGPNTIRILNVHENVPGVLKVRRTDTQTKHKIHKTQNTCKTKNKTKKKKKKKQINKILSQNANITKQISDSNPTIAYLVTDFELTDDNVTIKDIFTKINKMPESVRTRILY